MDLLQFIPFDSFIEYGFWDELCRRKLNDWKLDEEPKPAVATFVNNNLPTTNLRLSLSHDAFSRKNNHSRDVTRMEGNIIVFNTFNGFSSVDRTKIASDAFEKVKKSILVNDWLTNPSCLNTFVLTVYADLKKYQFYYWNCTATIIFPKRIWHRAKPKHYESLNSVIDDYLIQNCDKPFVLNNGSPTSLECLKDKDFNLAAEEHLIVFPDPSNKDSLPGWPLRNFIAALSYLRKEDSSAANILCYRRFGVKSFILHIAWEMNMELEDCKAIVGWDRDSKGQLKPNFVDLASSMDPIQLAKESVELNLRLMKWRLMPSINIDRYINLKCLILGCGTLGCNISRNLLGYGVRNITFVDCGEVSYSNPARQTLFDFSDAQECGKKKAEAAAQALRKIYPFLNANGVVMKIPMPGHSISPTEEKQVLSDISKLTDLIQYYDVVFLCTDSRESRWLPTLLATAYNKLAISVALGFDSYSVIRHGISFIEEQQEQGPSRDDREMLCGSMLGCYFCSDVTAPGNSVSDRTLDRQCTVSRAGISMTASGIAVELLAAVVQHPNFGASPASLGEPDELTTVLGATPHQIRGSFHNFKQITPTVKRFPHCVACGPAVISAYRERGMQFLLQTFNNPKHLEHLAGLDAFHANDVQLNFFEYDSDTSISA